MDLAYQTQHTSHQGNMNFKSLGHLEIYDGIEEAFLSENGYFLSDILGGPTAAKPLENFQAREDDVYVVSFPKTGTTWLQEIVYLIGTNLDFETSKNTPLMSRCPYMDCAYPEPPDVSNKPSPRFLKFHYPYSMLPKSIIDKKCKILSPIRNPKDTLISYYHFSKMNTLIGFNGDLSSYVDYFINDKILYGPYSSYILEFWERRHQENIMLVTYEDMSKDIFNVIHKIGNFMGKNLSEKDVAAIAQSCSFDSMKSRVKFSHTDNNVLQGEFFRKGKVGDWKNYFTEEMNKKMDEYVEKRFGGSGLVFTYE